MFADLSGRKAAERERNRLISAVEQSSESIMITDPNGIITYVNPTFEQMSGYDRAEVIGQNARILRSGRHDAEFYRSMWTTLLAGRVWTGDIINRRKDGDTFEVQAAISPIRDADGQVVNYLLISRNVTVERQLEQQLRQAQKMEAVGRLAGGVAHDFNNLLMAISGYSQLLLDGLEEGDARREYADEIIRAARQAASLTQQLLAFSRRQVLTRRILDLNTVVAEIQKMLTRLIGEDIDLVTSMAPELGKVRADRSQIEQVIMNLAVNARDAMPRGGRLLIETANVELDEDYIWTHAGARVGPYVMLGVSDTGVGMDAEIQSHVFEPFFTTKPKGEGTGLGLATVYGIVKQSDGYISVESEPGRGSTFRIYLPRVEEADGEEQVDAPSGGGSETILLAEDEREVREVVSAFLQEAGYSVIEAGDGEEAMRAAEEYDGPIHLLLTDVVMPRLSGRELAQRLLAERPATRILYMSGYTDDAVLRHGVLESEAAFLQKPFTADILQRKVREVLGAKDGEQDSAGQGNPE